MPFDAQAFMVLTSLHRCSRDYISIKRNANGIIYTLDNSTFILCIIIYD